jgi:hypothetical protein
VLDDPLEVAVFSVLVELVKKMDKADQEEWPREEKLIMCEIFSMRRR